MASRLRLISDVDPISVMTRCLAQALSGASRLGVAGGSVVNVLALLGQQVDLRETMLTWVDERLVSSGDPQSNWGQANRSGALGRFARELYLAHDRETGPEAVQRVSGEFTRHFGGQLDVALLGMGEDGHVASLFPGHRLLDEVSVDFAWLDDSPKRPSKRVTMTKKVLAARGLRRFVLATGEGKRAALEKLTQGDSRLPIAQLGELTVVTDQQFPQFKVMHGDQHEIE